MPKFYLIDDDIETVDGFDYRVRVWRNPGNSAVVVEPLPGSPPPDLYTTVLANRIARGQIGYAATRMAWYERYLGRCFFVSFKRIGSKLRPILTEPTYRPVDWAKVEEVLLGRGEASRKDEGEAKDHRFV